MHVPDRGHVRVSGPGLRIFVRLALAVAKVCVIENGISDHSADKVGQLELRRRDPVRVSIA